MIDILNKIWHIIIENKIASILLLDRLFHVYLNETLKKIVEPYIPDTNKINSYIRKFMRLLSEWAVVMLCFILVMLRDTPIDKLFMFEFLLLNIIITLNLLNLRTRQQLKIMQDAYQKIQNNSFNDNQS